MSRLAITAALEALEAGDQRLAVDVLLDLLEEADSPPASHRNVCPHCRAAFPWPGLLAQHLDVVHFEERAA
jgi:hypothetical protein